MTAISIICPQCGRNIIGQLGQAIFSDKLVWNLGYFCTCGLHIEEDGNCEMPVEWRQEIFKQDGRWALSVDVISRAETTRTLKVLREALHLTLPETQALSKHINDILLTGTRTEMEFLRRKLQQENVVAFVQKIDEIQAQNCPEFHCIDQ